MSDLFHIILIGAVIAFCAFLFFQPGIPPESIVVKNEDISKDYLILSTTSYAGQTFFNNKTKFQLTKIEVLMSTYGSNYSTTLIIEKCNEYGLPDGYPLIEVELNNTHFAESASWVTVNLSNTITLEEHTQYAFYFVTRSGTAIMYVTEDSYSEGDCITSSATEYWSAPANVDLVFRVKGIALG